MTRWVAATGVALLFATAPAAAQTLPRVEVTGPATNPITDGIGTFSIRAFDFAPADFPLRFQLQVSTSASFNGPFFADTIVDGPEAVVTIPRLLPGSGVLFWRAFALTARAGSVSSPITGPRVAPTHLRLISPNNPAGQSIPSRRPTFAWHSSTIPPLLGDWEYELRIEETATGRPIDITTITNDTTYTPGNDLEANTSYRWRVKSRLRATGDSVEVASAASFVILSDAAPLATVLLHPFPNPFPSPTSTSSCIWFDLREAGPVTLEIVNVRGLPVRRLVPGNDIGTTLQAGRYGRPFAGATSGCDNRFSWDGTDAAGRTVPIGLYIVRLRAGGRVLSERIIFSGR